MSFFLFGPIYRSIAKVGMEHLGRVVRLPAKSYMRFMWEKLNQGDLGGAIYYLEKASQDVITQPERQDYAVGVEAVLAGVDAYRAVLQRKKDQPSPPPELDKAIEALLEMRRKVLYLGKQVNMFDDIDETTP